jgi:hypothetical protein
LTVFLADRITAAGSTSELLDWDVLGPAVILALLIAIGVRVGRRLLGGSRAGADTASQADRRATG